MTIESTLLSVSVILEEDEAGRDGWRTGTEEDIRKAVLAAIAVLVCNRDAKVQWGSLTSMPLDGRPWFGRCAVCNRWVCDEGSPSAPKWSGISRGAKVDGHFRCDEHLPNGHPLCFGGRGYDGPVSEPPSDGK